MGRKPSSCPKKVLQCAARDEIDKRESFRNRIRCRILKAEVLEASPISVCRDTVGSR